MTDRRPLVRVASQILNRPVLMTEHWASVILSAVRSELNVDLLTTTEGVTLDHLGMDEIAAYGRRQVDAKHRRRAGAAATTSAKKAGLRVQEAYDRRIYPVVDGRYAVIEVSGTLTKNWGIDSYSGFTGYDGIKAKLVEAMDDDDIEGIVLDIDSPGGAVAGCFDLVDLIHAFNLKNGGKLIVGMANEMSCSAAYAIQTAADPGWRFVPRTGEVGSIGVLMMHTDVQKALRQEGVKVTIFRAGAHKAEGNAYEDMDKGTVERIQSTLDEMRDLFIDTVARNLATSTSHESELKKTIRETEALTYIGAHARDEGLVEAVASEDQVWARLMER